MTTPLPDRRRFQFSLRKLMLWTVVVALYCGFVAMGIQDYSNTQHSVYAFLGCILAIAFALRIAVRPWIACLLTCVVMGFRPLLVQLWFFFFPPSDLLALEIVFLEALVCCWDGCLAFLVMEVTARLAGWAYNLLRTKPNPDD